MMAASPPKSGSQRSRVSALTASTAHPETGPPPRGVILSPLVSEPLVFVCPADHPLSRRPAVTVPDLAEETILRFPPGWAVRDTVDRVLGADPAAIEIADYGLMLKLVQRRFGTTLMPVSAIADGHAGLLALPVDDARLRWSLSAAISASRRPTAATIALLRALSQAALPATQQATQPGRAPRHAAGGEHSPGHGS